MKKTTQLKLANTLGSNAELNKKIMQFKKSWDAVDAILKSAGTPKKGSRK